MRYLAIMYKLPYFIEQEQDTVLQFMHAHPFVTLISVNGASSVATQVPVLIEEKEGQLFLYGHVMRKTDHCTAMEQNEQALVLFTGPHCYVSPSWYTEKLGGTWNYQTIHVRGIIRILNDEETTDILVRLTDLFEAPQKEPLPVAALPDGYVQANIKAIAGFEIQITDVQAIFKLSQNRDDTSYQTIVHELQHSDDTDAHKIANEMIIRRQHLFQN